MSKKASPGLTDRQFGFVAVSVLAAVLAHLAHLSWPLATLILVLLLGGWAQRARTGRSVPIWIKLPLIGVLPAIVIAQYGNVFGREPGTALACGMLALKLLETTTLRDARAAICFCSFVLMSALLFDTSLVFTVLLFAVIILLLATLRELEPRPLRAPRVIWQQVLWQNLRIGAIALLAAVPLAAFAFVFFPRLDSPLWRTPGDATARTGMSDSMSPGSIQTLLVDDSPAFRVSFVGQVPSHSKLYWRGPVLTDFDGKTWTRRDSVMAHIDSNAIQNATATTSYEITLEANDKPWLFALDVPIEEPAESWRGSDMSLVRRRPVSELLRYHVTSALGYRLDAALGERQRRSALRLPEGFDPQSLALAQGWRKDLDSDGAIVHTALDLFHNAFFYTLSPPPLGRDSIDDFLFNTKRGFCEHYAAAFVFLMRAAGIPARVVTGYQGGYFNEVGNYLVVRQSDAHAWSEVWLHDKGWVRIDPTAVVSPARIELGAGIAAGASSPWYQAGWILTLRNQFDLVNRGWNSVIVQFNALRQQSLLTPFGIDKADYAALTWMLIGSSSVLLCLTVLWVMRTPRRHADRLDMAYAALCAKLARAGVIRAATEGPIDYAARAEYPQARALLNDYVSLRYACALPSKEAIADFARSVRRLRPLVRA
jgi:protein-glutamine gamma-glutamyltransferase